MRVRAYTCACACALHVGVTALVNQIRHLMRTPAAQGVWAWGTPLPIAILNNGALLRLNKPY